MLAGHDYDKPLASELTLTLHLTDVDEALTFDATITPEIARTSYGKDVLAQIDSGLVFGLTPGFRMPPEGGADLQEDHDRDQRPRARHARGDHPHGPRGAVVRIERRDGAGLCRRDGDVGRLLPRARTRAWPPSRRPQLEPRRRDSGLAAAPARAGAMAA